MQFLLMCCFDEARWNAISPSSRDAMMLAYRQWVDDQVANGIYVTGGKLDESHTATTVRKRDGKTVLKDGPFSEAKEQVGGFHVIECPDRHAATEIAQTIPTLPAGGTVEVRQLLHSLG